MNLASIFTIKNDKTQSRELQIDGFYSLEDTRDGVEQLLQKVGAIVIHWINLGEGWKEHDRYGDADGGRAKIIQHLQKCWVEENGHIGGRATGYKTQDFTLDSNIHPSDWLGNTDSIIDALDSHNNQAA